MNQNIRTYVDKLTN